MSPKCPSCGFSNIAGEDRCTQCFHSLMQKDIPHPHKNDKIQRAIMTTPISDLLTGEDLLIAKPQDTMEKIVHILQEEKKDCVLVYARRKLVGVLSLRDLLMRVAGKHKDLSKVTAEQVMTPKPEFVRAEDPIAYVINKMAVGGYRHVPVLAEDGDPLSIVSINDLLSILSQSAKTFADSEKKG